MICGQGGDDQSGVGEEDADDHAISDGWFRNEIKVPARGEFMEGVVGQEKKSSYEGIKKVGCVFRFLRQVFPQHKPPSDEKVENHKQD